MRPRPRRVGVERAKFSGGTALAGPARGRRARGGRASPAPPATTSTSVRRLTLPAAAPPRAPRPPRLSQKFTSEGTLGGAGFAGKLAGEYSAGDNLKLKKLELASKGTLTGELSLVGLADGVELTFEAVEGLRTSGAISKGELGASYTTDTVRADVAVDLINGPALSASAVTQIEGVIVGGKAGFNASSGSLDDYGVALGYNGSGYRVAAVTSKLETVKVGVHHQVDGNVAVAAAANFGLPQGKDKDGKDKPTEDFTYEVGGSYKLGSDSSVQAKFASSGKISANYETKLNTCATLTLAAGVDAKALGSDKHDLGLTLAFSG